MEEVKNEKKRKRGFNWSLIIAALIISFGLILNGAMDRYTFCSPEGSLYETLREDKLTGNIDILTVVTQSDDNHKYEWRKVIDEKWDVE